VSKTDISTLHPQLGDVVSSYIKTVENHLQKVVTSYQRDWEAILSIFFLAYRASTHSTQGITPSSLVFGRKFQLPCDMLLGAPRNKK
jgi:hypothetical protein